MEFKLDILNTLLGTIVNAATILLGTTIGLIFKKSMPEKIGKAVMFALGICTIFIGVSGMTAKTDAIIVILSMAIGTVLGTACKLDALLNRAGAFAESKAQSLSQKRRDKKATVTTDKPTCQAESKPSGTSTVGEAFVTSSLLFCVGAMTIVGSLNAGISGDNSTLFAKSVLDFVSSLIFASTLGYGVYFSAIVVLLLQGSISLLAGFVAPYLSTDVVTAMTCTGSLIILALGLNMLKVTKIKVMDMVPAIFLPILFIPLKSFILGMF